MTGAYYLLVAYGRGSWPELIATSSIPLLLACGLSIIRRGLRPGPLIGLAGSTVFWSGSHNISLVWGATVMGVIALAAAVAFARVLTAEHLRRIMLAMGVIALSVLVNAWFLLPDLRYAGRTGVGQFNVIDGQIGDPFSRVSVVFDPFRARALDNPYTRSHFTELPVLAMLWAIVASVVAWRARWRPGRRPLLTLLIVLTAGLTVLLVDDGAWSLVPGLLSHLQFTFRLETYIVMALVGVVVLLLAVMDHSAVRGSRALIGALAAIALFGLVLGTWQVWNSDAAYYPSSRAFLTDRSRIERYAESTPPTWYVYDLSGSFRDASAPTVATHGILRLNPAAVRGDTLSQTVRIPAGTGALATNIASPTYLVSVTGLPVAGRTGEGYLALGRPPGPAKTVRITVREAPTTALRVGPYLTVLGLAGLAASVLACLMPPVRRRRHARS